MASSPAAAPPHGAGAVCCMCGDHGLQDELFRCRCCRARLQHRYCSDLYPRAAAYRRCNWCLRAPPPPRVVGRAGHATAVALAVANSKPPEEKRKTTASASSDEERRQRLEEGCSTRRSSPAPAELGHPVKKKHSRATEEKTPQTASASDEERQRYEGCSPSQRRSSSPPAELGQPVKKKHRAAEEKTAPQPAAVARKKEIVSTGAVASGSGSKDEEVMRAGKARVNSRVRVRRYKLLTEVISC